MIKLEEVMDIKSLSRQGYSIREITRRTGLNRRTVKKYLEAKEAPKYQVINRKSKLDSYKGLIQGWLSQEDYKATRLYELAQQEGFDGSYNILQRYVQKLKEERDRKAYIRFETMPGQQAQVDFGDFHVTEPDGSTKTVYAFSMVLGYSRHMYVEYLERCTLPLFLGAHQHAFGFFGGIPAEILYDNMKNVVIRRKGPQVEWNAAFEAFALHYGFKPMLAPPYAPWVKGKVERPMDYIRERFWRGYRYENLIRTNQDIRYWLKTTAFERIHGTTRQKVRDRFETERPSLGKLPEHPYDLSLKYARKVHKDCQIAFEGNRYVLPHELVGKQVLLKVKEGLVRVFDNERLVTVYRIPREKGKTLAHPQFYKRLLADREQNRRKYASSSGKGKATRGLLSRELNVEVMRRPLSIYEEVTL